MEEDSFPHPAIREQARRSFIPLKLRADLNEELALGFELSGLPATVVISPSRQVLAVHEGYMGPEELNGLLDQACQRFRPAELLASAKQTKSPTETAGKPAGPPKKEPELALSGYCPVSLIADRRLVAGSAEYTVSHEGRSYRLANLLTFNLFQRDPERYIPSNQGNCPVAKLERKVLEPGDPRFGVLFEGRLFLCATKADRDRFIKEPERFAAVDVVDQGFCVHCLAENGTYVRGNPRVALSREGRRYWFPDASHRDAFVTASASATMRR